MTFEGETKSDRLTKTWPFSQRAAPHVVLETYRALGQDPMPTGMNSPTRICGETKSDGSRRNKEVTAWRAFWFVTWLGTTIAVRIFDDTLGYFLPFPAVTGH